MPSGIYCILNSVNDKVYIGSAANLAKRRWVHFEQLRNRVHKNPHLQNAFTKYAEDAFSFHVLEVISNKAELTRSEQFWLDVFNPSETYNIARTAGSNLGRRFSEDSKRKLSAGVRSRGIDWIKKVSAASIASWRDPDSRSRRLSKMGSAEVRNKISAASKRQWSDTAARQKLVAAAKKRWANPENRKQQAERTKAFFAKKRLWSP